MLRYLEAYAGVFTPEQVKSMQEEMDRGAVPGESEQARAKRAFRILIRTQLGRDLPHCGPDSANH